MEPKFLFEMGQKVYDCVTGFTGIITGRVQYITGCHQYLLTSKHDQSDNQKSECLWYDEGRLIIEMNTSVLKLPTLEQQTVGPDMEAPIK